MAKYDYSKVSREALEYLATQLAATAPVGWCANTPLSNALATVRSQALVKTRAEYDREIGKRLRSTLYHDYSGPAPCLSTEWWDDLRALVNASRTATEDE